MPRVLRREHKRIGHTDDHYQELLYGHVFGRGGFGYDHLSDAVRYSKGRGDTRAQAAGHRRVLKAVRAEMKALWEGSKDRLMDEWFDSVSLCTRPWAWWTFDATEPRLQVSDGPLNSTMPDGQLDFGVPRMCGVRADFDCEYELQAVYLDRLRLFLPGEQRYWNKHKAAWLAEVAAEGMDETKE